MPYRKEVDGVLFVNPGSVAAAGAVRASGLPAKFARDLELGGAPATAGV
jgi:hypothetical protein